MTRRGVSTPTPVGALLTTVLPPLAERLLARAIERDWPALVGPQVSQRSRPRDLRDRTLTVLVDNSPWLQEMTLREREILARVQARYGSDAIKALRFALGTPPSAAAEP